MMNVLKQLLGGGKKVVSKQPSKKEKRLEVDEEFEREHFKTDFDKTFEEAKRSTSSPINSQISHCDYRGHSGSPAPAKSRSKSPSPYPQQQVQKQRTPSKMCIRKASEPSRLPLPVGGDSKEKMRRKLTHSQQQQAKEIVESLDWVQPVVHQQPQVCFASSAKPQVVQSQMITPQIHICEALPIARPATASAIIPQHNGRRSLAAPGKMVVHSLKP